MDCQIQYLPYYRGNMDSQYKIKAFEANLFSQTEPIHSKDTQSKDHQKWFDQLKIKLQKSSSMNKINNTSTKDQSSSYLTNNKHQSKADYSYMGTPKNTVSRVSDTQIKSGGSLLNVKKQFDSFDQEMSRYVNGSVNSEKKSYIQNSKSEKSEFYIYWKKKANAFQTQIFVLRDQNSALKHEIQTLKSKECKLQQQSKNLWAKQQENKKLEQKLQQKNQNQKHLHVHITKIQRQLAMNRVLLKNMQYKFSKEGSTSNFNGNNFISDAALMRSMKDKIRKLKQQNLKYQYIIKQLEQDLRGRGLDSIWIGNVKPSFSSQGIFNSMQQTEEIELERQRKSKSKEKSGLKRMMSLDPCQLDMCSTNTSIFNFNSKETIDELIDQQ